MWHSWALFRKGAASMPVKKYLVTLTTEERQELLKLTGSGELSARKMKRALILLKANEGWRDEEIVAALHTSRPTVERVRKRYVEGGLDKALNDDPRPGARKKLDGRAEARLIALACSEEGPDDSDHWSLRAIADELVELGLVGSISHEAVRQYLKKTN
jgi:transposase